MTKDLLTDADISNQKCNDRATINKEDIALSDGTSITWKTPLENNLLNTEISGYGLQNSYDGSGYVVAIDYDIKRSEYIAKVTDLFNSSDFFDQEKLTAFICSIAFYIPSHDWLISLNILIEFD